MKSHRARVYVARPDKSSGAVGPQAQYLVPCIDQDKCGVTGISAGIVYMPPMGLSRVHYHVHSEIVVMCTQGWAATLIGDGFEPFIHGPGQLIYIPAGVVHCAVNLSSTEELTAVEIRTDPTFNGDVVVVPELQAEACRRADQLRDAFRRIGPDSLALPA